MHSDKKRCADTLSLSRQAEQNRAEERVSIDTKKGSKYNKSNEKRGGGIQLKKRKWKFRIAGGAVTLLGIYLMADRLRRDDHTHHRHGCPDFRHCHLVHGNPGELQFHDGYDCHDLHGEAAENRRIL